jgi:hypothetical protein
VAPSGIGLLLQSFGFNPEEIKGSVESFIAHMKDQAAAINANQARIETKLDTIIDLLPRAMTTPILENGEATGVLVTNEKFPQEMLDDVQQRGQSQ